MKLTPHDKKLLKFWPLLWPVFIYLIFFQPHRPGWARFFFIAIALLLGLIALAFGARSLWKIFRKPKTLAQQILQSHPQPYRLQTKATPHSPITHHASRNAFTLIELLVVIAIIGLLAAILAPALHHIMKPDASVSATRQMLDDCARARQLAIASRSTVYMVFVPANFWQDPMRPGATANQWNVFASTCPGVLNSTTVTNLYSAQWNGYAMYSLRHVGDQPGASHPDDLLATHTLPPGSFIAPIKFSWPAYPAPPFFIRTNYAMYGFFRSNTIPFPTATALTNAAYVNALALPGRAFTTVPYIAFNYLGQLTPGDGAVSPVDEIIPLAYGSIAPTKTQVAPNVAEQPPGNSTNISYNLIHIDRLTGRARLEREDQL